MRRVTTAEVFPTAPRDLETVAAEWIIRGVMITGATVVCVFRAKKQKTKKNAISIREMDRVRKAYGLTISL